MRKENSFISIHYLTIQYSLDTNYIRVVLNNCYPLSLNYEFTTPLEYKSRKQRVFQLYLVAT